MDKEFLGIVAAGVLAVATVALARRQSLFFQLLDVTLRVAALATFFFHYATHAKRASWRPASFANRSPIALGACRGSPPRTPAHPYNRGAWLLANEDLSASTNSEFAATFRAPDRCICRC